jgi:hypothetical protein
VESISNREVVRYRHHVVGGLEFDDKSGCARIESTLKGIADPLALGQRLSLLLLRASTRPMSL